MRGKILRPGSIGYHAEMHTGRNCFRTRIVPVYVFLVVSLTAISQPLFAAETYVWVHSWGTTGSGPEQFNNPHSVAIDPGGYIYVTDQENNRIQKLNSDGDFVANWSTSTSPCGIALDSLGNVYVANNGSGVIQRFTSSGVLLNDWSSNDAGQIAVDSAGDVYVNATDGGNGLIRKYTSTGTLITQWGGFSSFALGGLVIDSSDYVYVSDTNGKCVRKFTSIGTEVDEWATVGLGGVEFRPGGLALDNSNSVFVCDYDGAGIEKFTNSGSFVTDWGSYGSGNGEFNAPTGIAVDGAGTVYVADHLNDRIQVFVVPEPATLSLFALGGLALIRRRTAQAE